MADIEMVRVKHPEVGLAPDPVSRAAFESTWADLGWEIVSDAEADKADAAAAKKAATATKKAATSAAPKEG